MPAGYFTEQAAARRVQLRPGARPSIPFTDTLKPRRVMYLLKRHGLPALYWQGMLKGRA